jgi:biopolymer transport protein ExbD
MAAITEGLDTFRQRAGVRRAKKHSLKMDLTPMVDLGFLLISFFVITTQLTEPRAALINMPHDGPPMPIPNSSTLTVLIKDSRHLYYYDGNWGDAIKQNEIHSTTLDLKTGLGSIIRTKQALLDQSIVKGEGRTRLMVLIKASKNADYSQVIDVLDEMLINDVKKYAIVKPTLEELELLNTSK